MSSPRSSRRNPHTNRQAADANTGGIECRRSWGSARNAALRGHSFRLCVDRQAPHEPDGGTASLGVHDLERAPTLDRPALTFICADIYPLRMLRNRAAFGILALRP